MAGPWEQYQSTATPEAAPWAKYAAAAAALPGASSPADDSAGSTPSYLGTFGNGVAKGVTGIADAVANGVTGLPREIGTLATQGFNAPPPADITPVRDAAQATGLYDPKREPTDSIGKAADFIGQIVGSGGINPAAITETAGREGIAAGAKQLLGQAASSAAAGTGGSVAGQVADKFVPNNPYVHALAQTLGSAVGGGAVTLRDTPGQIAKSSLEGMTPEQEAQINALMSDATDMGTPVTTAEAIAKVRGPNILQNVQRVVEQSPAGQKILGPMMNARPDNNAAAFTGAADEVGSMPGDLYKTPYNLANAAQGALDKAYSDRTAAVSPYYEAAKGERIQPAQAQKLNDAIATVLNPAMGGVAPGSKVAKTLGAMSNDIKGSGGYVNALDKIYANMRDNLASPDINPDSMTRTERGVVGPINEQLGAITGENPNIGKGRGLYADISENVVNPLVQSPVGSLAKTQTEKGEPLNADSIMRAQSSTLMPTTPKALNPDTIKYTVAQLGPEKVTPWVRQNIQSIFDEANQNLQSGVNQWGGAKFASLVRGNSQQGKNLEALVTASAGPDTWNGLGKFLDVMEAQGKREPPNSMTAYNQKLIERLSSPDNAFIDLAPAAFEATKDGGGTALALEATNYLKHHYENWKFGQNTNTMAKMLTDPDAIEKLKQLAQQSASSPRARILVAGLVANATSALSSPAKSQGR